MELLRELGPFHYMMNQGNVGDALIAASTVALFEREELNFSSCGPELPAGKEEITLVYGGGACTLTDRKSGEYGERIALGGCGTRKKAGMTAEEISPAFLR